MKNQAKQNLKVEVKSVKLFNGHDGQGLNCDVFVEGKKTCSVIDDGWGGGFQYQVIDQDKFDQFKAYVKAQPKYKSSIDGSMFPVNMDMVVDNLVKEVLEAKEKKKLEKIQETSIVIGHNLKKGNYSYIQFRKPLKDLPKEVLQTEVNKQKAKLKPTECFWNTNFNQLGINI